MVNELYVDEKHYTLSCRKNTEVYDRQSCFCRYLRYIFEIEPGYAGFAGRERAFSIFSAASSEAEPTKTA